MSIFTVFATLRECVRNVYSCVSHLRKYAVAQILKQARGSHVNAWVSSHTNVVKSNWLSV